VDVLEHDVCQKLARWFDDRWNDRFCLELSEELIAVIDESWAREEPLTPYEVYLKMAYRTVDGRKMARWLFAVKLLQQ
jgi:hypothetical protein